MNPETSFHFATCSVRCAEPSGAGEFVDDVRGASVVRNDVIDATENERCEDDCACDDDGVCSIHDGFPVLDRLRLPFLGQKIKLDDVWSLRARVGETRGAGLLALLPSIVFVGRVA